MNNNITAQATASRQIAQRLRASRRNCPTTAARRSAALLRLTVSAKVAFSDRTVEQASGLCREGWEDLSRRESRSCFAYYPILFSTSYSSICICLVCSGQSASILKMPVANNLLYLKAIGTLRREYAALLDTLGWFEKTLSDTIGLQCRIRRRHAFTSSRSPCAAAFRWIQNERAGFNPKLARAGFKFFSQAARENSSKCPHRHSFSQRPDVTGSCPHAN